MSIFHLQLETDRLLLRPPQAADFKSRAAFIADEEAKRFVGGGTLCMAQGEFADVAGFREFTLACPMMSSKTT